MAPNTMNRLPRLPARQQGVVLFIALIVLIAMTRAGIAMMRSVGGGLGIAGNLAFRQGATSAADKGVELGIAWLTTTVTSAPTVLDSDQPVSSGNISNGLYFSSWDGGAPLGQPFNPLTYDFKANVPLGGTDAAGNSVYYVVHRLCNAPNLAVNAGGQKCITVQETIGTGSSTTAASYNSQQLTSSNNPYYRITTYTEGPRGTKSYVQVIAKAAP